MAAAGCSFRDKTYKTSRAYNRNRSENEDEIVHLDINKDDNENLYEVLRNICQKQGLTDGKRLAYINAFIKLIDNVNKSRVLLSISKRDIICCLRVPLVSNNAVIRAAALRALRRCINDSVDVSLFNKLQIPHLVARSLDLVLKNDHERIQALRLSLKILKLSPKHFSLAVTRSLVSLVNSVNETKDRMIISSLSTVCQLCILNPELTLDCSGDVCLLRCCVEIASSRINECLVGCLLFLLNKPQTRLRAKIQLDYITSIFCDLQRKKYNPQDGAINTVMCSRLSVLAALRTWSGIVYLCNPANSSGMRAVINILYLNAPDLKKEILDLLYEAVGLDVEDSVKDVSSAFDFVEGKPQDSWRLNEGFIVSEGKDLLPHKADTRPNLTEVHTALLIHTFLECGLFPALVEVICSDTNLSIQAIILLGFLLHLSHKLLPNELLELSTALPMLLHHATNGLPYQKTQAIVAISLLHRVHRLFSKQVSLNSLFLKKLYFQGKCDPITEKLMVIKNVDAHIKEAEIFYHRDPRHWNWTHVKAILKCRGEALLKLDDIQHRTTLRKIVHFFKLSSSQFSAIPFSYKDKSNEIYISTGFLLLDFLVECQQEEAQKQLDEFLTDLAQQLEHIVTGGSVHECLSPHLMSTTLTQYYFLLIGHLTLTRDGLKALEKCRMFDVLLKIIDTTPHDIYIKLIISSLNYNDSTVTRTILSKALTSPNSSIRIFATDLLLIMARANIPLFHKWGLDLLMGQIYDANKLVANAAIDALHELCYDPAYLDALIEIRPSLLHLGDKGHLLLIRFIGTLSGFAFLDDSNFIRKELETWEKGYNLRYVGLVESLLHDALTLHQRSENGRYSRRLTNAKHKWKHVLIPPHLYGELSRHEPGLQLLSKQPIVNKMIQTVQMGHCYTDTEILELKSSLWALCNIAVSHCGLKFLQQSNLVHYVVDLAQTCAVLAVRATAFYCISLIATTESGANTLADHDWVSVRRTRKEHWPVERTEHLLRPETLSPSLLDYKDSSSVLSIDYLDDIDVDTELSNANVAHSLTLPKTRATTLPPGFTCSFDYTRESREMSSPTSSSYKRGHQRSHSETSSLVTNISGVKQRLSFQDAVGLATLQHIQSTRRPDAPTPLFSELENPVISRISADRSSSHMIDFEAENPPLLFVSVSNPSLSPNSTDDDDPDADENVPKMKKPDYLGISLPRALAQYLSLTNTSNIIDRREERRRKRGSVSFSEMEQVKELEEENSSSSSSSHSEENEENDDEKKEEAVKKQRHDASQCIACCTRIPRNRRHRKISTGSFRLRTDTESSYGGGTAIGGDGSSPITLKGRLNKATSEGGSVESVGGGESGGDGIAVSNLNFLPPPVLSQTRVRRDILKHVQRMCNPVWAKASRQALLQMKRSHPSVFQDVCLYSNVCSILCSSTCRVTARRFIQELFLDLTFVQLYEDAAAALNECNPSSDSANTSNSKSVFDQDATIAFLSSSTKPSSCKNPVDLATVFENTYQQLQNNVGLCTCDEPPYNSSRKQTPSAPR